MQTYPPGTRIGQYEIASRPMMGGMGVVYFALDHNNRARPVALEFVIGAGIHHEMAHAAREMLEQGEAQPHAQHPADDVELARFERQQAEKGVIAFLARGHRHQPPD